MQVFLNSAEGQLLVTMNSNLRKTYFTLLKIKTKYEIYSVPDTNAKVRMKQYYSLSIPWREVWPSKNFYREISGT